MNIDSSAFFIKIYVTACNAIFNFATTLSGWVVVFTLPISGENVSILIYQIIKTADYNLWKVLFPFSYSSIIHGNYLWNLVTLLST